MSRRRSRTEEKRLEILHAAAQVYAREGYNAATMAQVATEADVAIGTLYLYFKDKEELRLAVVESMAERLLASVDETESQPRSVEVKRLSMPDTLEGADVETLFLRAPRSRRERESMTKRREILGAASRVFAREGFHPATMAQVAAEAGVAVGTLYLYFGKKEDLYSRLVEEKAEELLSLLRAESQRAPRALGKLRRIVAAELQFFARNREFHGIQGFTRRSPASASPRENDRREDHRHAAYVEMMTTIIEQGIAEGEIRDAPPADLTCVLVGMVNSMVGKWMIEEAQDSLPAKADWLVDLFSRAVAPDPGVKA